MAVNFDYRAETGAVGNYIEINILTPTQLVVQWAEAKKISREALERLFEDGFTSLEAIKLLDIDDLTKSKIPRGQKKLICLVRTPSTMWKLPIFHRRNSPATGRGSPETPGGRSVNNAGSTGWWPCYFSWNSWIGESAKEWTATSTKWTC